MLSKCSNIYIPYSIDNFTCVNWYHIVRTIISNFDTPFAYIIPTKTTPTTDIKWEKSSACKVKSLIHILPLGYFPQTNKICKICSIKMQFCISGSPGKSFRGCSYIRLNLPTVWWQLGQEWMTSLHPSMQNGIRQQPSHKLKKNQKFKNTFD